MNYYLTGLSINIFADSLVPSKNILETDTSDTGGVVAGVVVAVILVAGIVIVVLYIMKKRQQDSKYEFILVGLLTTKHVLKISRPLCMIACVYNRGSPH